MTPTADWLQDIGIAELQRRMEKGELTAAGLTEGYLLRIAAYDKQGPMLNAVLEVNPEAMAIAEGLDAERRAKGARGPLHGIPLLLKDNIDTGDGMMTSAGSIALVGHYATRDSHLVSRLREAGAVILGKTNMTEWANFMTQGMPGGYSSRGGQVLNPYGCGRLNCGGSSSGSGAAVAASLAAAAVGTETSGSILSPAVCSSVVGIKPTVGLISRSGVIPLAMSQDTPGPLARIVEDAALLLGAMAGPDADDPATASGIGRVCRDYTPFLDAGGLEGARIGVPRRRFHDRLPHDEGALFEEHLEAMRAAGAVVVDPAEIPSAAELAQYQSTVFRHEFKAGINRYLSRLAPHLPVHSLKDLILFNTMHHDEALRYGQDNLLIAEDTSGMLTEPRYLEDRLTDLRLSRREGIDAVMREHGLQALVFPGTAGASIAAKAGYPSVTVPGGYVSGGRPVGVTFTGGAYAEPQLIRIAYAFEQLRGMRRRPIWL
ncbi:amidase family protein [Paenibacillus sp. S-38]|uniref:amidase family protein n=1 Tax=Paenibacillus sp. S-38 TaxID=3416710 RepID=UPI003CF945B2